MYFIWHFLPEASYNVGIFYHVGVILVVVLAVLLAVLVVILQLYRHRIRVRRNGKQHSVLDPHMYGSTHAYIWLACDL